MHRIPHRRLGEQSLPDRNTIFMRSINGIGQRYHFFKTLNDSVRTLASEQGRRLGFTFVISSKSLLFSFLKMALSSAFMTACDGWQW